MKLRSTLRSKLGTTLGTKAGPRAHVNRRWVVKKAARAGVTLGSALSGSVLLRSALAGGACVRALTYHRVADDSPEDPFCVTRDAFDAQMRLLAEEGRAVSLAQVQRFVADAPGEREALPKDACLVTIDDGCLSTLTEVLPTLRRWNVPAVVFVSSALIGAEYEGLPERYVTWDELRELDASPLVTIGSHAHTHRSLGLMAPAEAKDEARRSRETLEAQLGHEVRCFAYPFGTRADFNRVTDRALADAGYHIAFNSMHGAIRAGADPISLPRVKVEGGEPLALFRLQSRGAMDAWRVVDTNLHRLQRVRQEIV
ncbi:MAG: polysaccharide deacetylase family protein [Myxococcales bacterium]|nr:polysaccharide deacetylase family protein [Myxococcales bacterium]MCB9630391.1 polysaccharide deacetylase family protein [Sandaracinaceae bacterium]